mgnify:CR=1 FL=1
MANPVFGANNIASDSSRVLKPTNQNIKDAVKAVYDTLAPSFQSKYGISLSVGLTKVPSLNLHQKSATEQQRERRHKLKQVKADIENQMRDTAFERSVRFSDKKHLMYISCTSICHGGGLSLFTQSHFY